MSFHSERLCGVWNEYRQVTFFCVPKKGRLINPYKSKSVKIEMKERYLTLNQNCENPDLQNA